MVSCSHLDTIQNRKSYAAVHFSIFLYGQQCNDHHELKMDALNKIIFNTIHIIILFIK